MLFYLDSDILLQESISNEIYALMVSTPVENCQNGTSSPIESEVQLTTTVGETWSLSYEVGFSLEGILLASVTSAVTWSQEQTSQWAKAETIGIKVQPGEKVGRSIGIVNPLFRGSIHSLVL